MVESFQDYGDYNRFSCLYTVCLKATDHLKYLAGILQVLRLEFQKFRILEILNFPPCICAYLYLKFCRGVWGASVFIINNIQLVVKRTQVQL